MLTYKDGVTGPPQEPLLEGLAVVDKVYKWFGRPGATVTAIRNGEHSPTSLHPKGYAADIRNSDVPAQFIAAIHATIRGLLGPAYTFIIETDTTPGATAQHFHLEFDPMNDGGKYLPA